LNLNNRCQQRTIGQYADRTEDAHSSLSQLKVPTVGLVTFWRRLSKYSVVFVVDVSSTPTGRLSPTRFVCDSLVFNDLNFFLTRSILNSEANFRPRIRQNSYDNLCKEQRDTRGDTMAR
jgi:hypothetical protein